MSNIRLDTWTGPFEIREVYNPYSYRIQNMATRKEADVPLRNIEPFALETDTLLLRPSGLILVRPETAKHTAKTVTWEDERREISRSDRNTEGYYDVPAIPPQPIYDTPVRLKIYDTVPPPKPLPPKLRDAILLQEAFESITRASRNFFRDGSKTTSSDGQYGVITRQASARARNVHSDSQTHSPSRPEPTLTEQQRESGHIHDSATTSSNDEQSPQQGKTRAEIAETRSIHTDSIGDNTEQDLPSSRAEANTDDITLSVLRPEEFEILVGDQIDNASSNKSYTVLEPE